MDPEDHREVEAELNALRAGDNSIFTADQRGNEADECEEQIEPGRGQILSINVNLERPTGELVNFIRSIIDKKRDEREIRVKRAKPHRVDPWRVWDMMQVSGKNLLTITHTLFKVNGTPAYDEKTKIAYDRVRRAYRKAVAMIEEAGMLRNEEPTKEAMEASTARFISIMEEMFRRGKRWTSFFKSDTKRKRIRRKT